MDESERKIAELSSGVATLQKHNAALCLALRMTTKDLTAEEAIERAHQLVHSNGEELVASALYKVLLSVRENEYHYLHV